MDFFDRQETARKKTKVLIVYFALAVIGITLSVYAVLLVVNLWGSNDLLAEDDFELLDWPLLAGASIGTLAVILFGTGFKSLQLSAGGAFVAKELGGRRVDQQTNNPAERRLLNIVEEMAIASGVPVPDVYVLEGEDTVNAFAAGKTPSDAVIGVTRGCMRMLSRDELQGVIAHEYSHILNGDMRLNMRLIALIFGITALTIVGRILLHSTSGSRNRNGAPFLFIGLALIIIGFVGILCGRLIQRAVSRQREFLADASAVQFTRNPDGMSGALKKIGALGSRVDDPHIEEASHMMIASALSNDRGSLFATHPPLAARIRAIDPHWDGTFDDVRIPSYDEGRGRRAVPSRAGGAGKASLAGDEFIKAAGMLSAGALAHLGELHGEHLNQAQAIIQEFPSAWREMAGDPSGAQMIVLALLLAQGEGKGDGKEILLQHLDEGTCREIDNLQRAFEALHSSRKLALVDLAIASLRRLSRSEYQSFLRIMTQLMESDERIDLFEFTIQKVIKRHLDIHFHKTKPAEIYYRQLSQLKNETAVLLSTLATLSGDDESHHLAAFAAGADMLRSELGGEPIRYQGRVGLEKIDEALAHFDAATPRPKKLLLHAAARTVTHDERTTSQEAELLRAMADTIGVPIPPFVQQVEPAP